MMHQAATERRYSLVYPLKSVYLNLIKKSLKAKILEKDMKPEEARKVMCGCIISKPHSVSVV